MKNRSPIVVLILTFVTFGIYGLVWFVKTKGEMNSQGATIPTAWLLIIPIANLYWMWKYAEGVQQITKGAQSQAMAFILLLLIAPIGMVLFQSAFNKLSELPVGSPAPA